MKVLLYIFILFVSVESFGVSKDFDKHLREYDRVNQLLPMDLEEGLLNRIIKRAKRNTHNFYKNYTSFELVEHFYSINNLFYLDAQTEGDLWERVVAFFRAIYGHKVTQFLIRISSTRDVQEASRGIWTGYQKLKSKDTCPDGVIELGQGLAYLTAYIAVGYYTYQFGPMPAHASGMVAKELAPIIIDVVDGQNRICNLKHGGEIYEIPIISNPY